MYIRNAMHRPAGYRGMPGDNQFYGNHDAYRSNRSPMGSPRGPPRGPTRLSPRESPRGTPLGSPTSNRRVHLGDPRARHNDGASNSSSETNRTWHSNLNPINENGVLLSPGRLDGKRTPHSPGGIPPINEYDSDVPRRKDKHGRKERRDRNKKGDKDDNKNSDPEKGQQNSKKPRVHFALQNNRAARKKAICCTLCGVTLLLCVLAIVPYAIVTAFTHRHLLIPSPNLSATTATSLNPTSVGPAASAVEPRTLLSAISSKTSTASQPKKPCTNGERYYVDGGCNQIFLRCKNGYDGVSIRSNCGRANYFNIQTELCAPQRNSAACS